MKPRALIFGAIGTMAETSELQRQAFNSAFEAAGQSVRWDETEYRSLLGQAGGAQRVARALGLGVDDPLVKRIHQHKTERFQALIESAEPEQLLREGFETLVLAAQSAGVKVAIASTTFKDSLMTVLRRCTAVREGHFAAIVSLEDVDRPKPDPEVYRRALAALGVEPSDAVAIEDTAVSLAAPVAAGIPTILVPGAFAPEGSSAEATRVVASLTEIDVESPLRAA